MATQPLTAPTVPVQIPHFSRILVPVDFSDVCMAAYHRAIDLAEIYHASIVLTHVMTNHPVRPLPALIPEDVPTPELKLSDDLELLRHLALARGVPCTTVFRKGDVTQNIRDIIQRESIDLAVLATHGGRSKFGFFLGSTAQELVRTLAVPVLTVGSCQRPPNWDDKGPRHILFAGNFEKETLCGLSLAIGMQQVTSAQLSVVEVVPVGTWPDIHRVIRQRIASLVPPGIDIHTPLGLVGSTVNELAAQINAGLIVLGVHRDGFVRDLVSSNLLDILVNAPCPVLTLRESVEQKHA